MGSEFGACPSCRAAVAHMDRSWIDRRHCEAEVFYVQCQQCCASGPPKDSWDEAAAAWNGVSTLCARAEAAEQRAAAAEAEVARLRAVIADEAAELPALDDVIGILTCRRVAERVRCRLLAAVAEGQAAEVSDG